MNHFDIFNASLADIENARTQIRLQIRKEAEEKIQQAIEQSFAIEQSSFDQSPNQSTKQSSEQSFEKSFEQSFEKSFEQSFEQPPKQPSKQSKSCIRIKFRELANYEIFYALQLKPFLNVFITLMDSLATEYGTLEAFHMLKAHCFELHIEPYYQNELKICESRTFK